MAKIINIGFVVYDKSPIFAFLLEHNPRVLIIAKYIIDVLIFVSNGINRRLKLNKN